MLRLFKVLQFGEMKVTSRSVVENGRQDRGRVLKVLFPDIEGKGKPVMGFEEGCYAVRKIRGESLGYIRMALGDPFIQLSLV